MDRHLRFELHTKATAARVQRRTRTINPLLASRVLSQRTNIILYKALLRPILFYASPAWSGIATPKARRTMDVAERMILCILLQLGWTFNNIITYSLSNIEEIAVVAQKQAEKFFQRLPTRSTEHLRRLADDAPLPWDKFPRPTSVTKNPVFKPQRRRLISRRR